MPRNAISTHTGKRTLLRNSRKPPFQANSEITATGHIQEQKERRSSSESRITVTKTITAAGCIEFISPPFTQYAVPNKPEMGRNPSIPSGRVGMDSVTPALTICTKR